MSKISTATITAVCKASTLSTAVCSPFLEHLKYKQLIVDPFKASLVSRVVFVPSYKKHLFVKHPKYKLWYLLYTFVCKSPLM